MRERAGDEILCDGPMIEDFLELRRSLFCGQNNRSWNSTASSSTCVTMAGAC
jgi:hypothetical protein